MQAYKKSAVREAEEKPAAALSCSSCEATETAERRQEEETEEEDINKSIIFHQYI